MQWSPFFLAIQFAGLCFIIIRIGQRSATKSRPFDCDLSAMGVGICHLRNTCAMSQNTITGTFPKNWLA